MKSVYCAVRNGSLNKAYWSRDAPTGLTFNNCTLCPHCIYVFCIYLRTNSDLCHLQHKLIGFYDRDEKCLLRGTDWVFKYSSLRFVCKGLMNPPAVHVGCRLSWLIFQLSLRQCDLRWGRSFITLLVASVHLTISPSSL